MPGKAEALSGLVGEGEGGVAREPSGWRMEDVA